MTGAIVYDGRFDEDDFDTAYRELEQPLLRRGGCSIRRSRAPSATECTIALNQGDFDRAFGELTLPRPPRRES